jgi:hypothetical protein
MLSEFSIWVAGYPQQLESCYEIRTDPGIKDGGAEDPSNRAFWTHRKPPLDFLSGCGCKIRGPAEALSVKQSGVIYGSFLFRI